MRYVSPAPFVYYLIALTVPCLAILHVGGANRHFWTNIAIAVSIIMLAFLSMLFTSGAQALPFVPLGLFCLGFILPIIHAFSVLMRYDYTVQAFSNVGPYPEKGKVGVWAEGMRAIVADLDRREGARSGPVLTVNHQTMDTPVSGVVQIAERVAATCGGVSESSAQGVTPPPYKA